MALPTAELQLDHPTMHLLEDGNPWVLVVGIAKQRLQQGPAVHEGLHQKVSRGSDQRAGRVQQEQER